MVAQKKSTNPRGYRMGRRREQLEATRSRIAAAAFELHATVGPAQTSISAVAERAGVQRHTVYHHFPDLGALFRACTEHGMQVTRTPEAAPWRAIDDPTARLRFGLGQLYGYYRANTRLLGNFARDMQLMFEVGGAEAYIARMAELFQALAEGWPGDAANQRLRMAA
ncbi:MAG TPA: helix-turn-helix domain-containing protein, partial [Candidatus Limnocylindrales bacterium]|nr:helix-turn-helix domain-containing protein [Candidatus Limnocylindrales bacterium]